MRIPFTGEFVSDDWEKGIEKERVKSIEKQGSHSYLGNVNSVNYMGKKLSNHAQSFISKRLFEMPINSCEIIRVGSPVSYIRFSTGLKESRTPMQVTYDMVTCVANYEMPGKAYLDGCYVLMDIEGKRVHYLKGENNIDTLRRFVFPLLQAPKSDRIYYIQDRNKGVYYKCSIQKEELTKVADTSNNGQIIIPLYKYLYYGCRNI